jgi:HK97 family phage major capsid protein
MEALKEVKEINERMAQIDKEIKDADIEALHILEKEIEALKTRRAEALKSERERIERAFENSKPIIDPDKADNRLTTREKICKAIGLYRRGGISEIEARALGVSLTTTATEYVPASADADGVNNGGLFIPTKVLFDLLKETTEPSPIFNAINFTQIKGLTEFILTKSRDEAYTKEEGKATFDNQIEWDTLKATTGTLQSIIVVTDELRALTDIDFGQYIIDELLKNITEDWTKELIYAPGVNRRITGLIQGALLAGGTDGYEAGEVYEAIKAGIKLLDKKYRKSPAIYLATDVYDELLFREDDVGRPLYPVINNIGGISSIGPYKCYCDTNLKAGDFVIGNISQYFKVNINQPLTIETERLVTRGVTKYVAREMCSTAVLPGAIVYGHRAD